MARDENLAFVTSSTEAKNTGDIGDEIDTEGGFWAVIRLLLGTWTGTSAIVDIQVLCSIDGGSTDFHIGQFPVLDEDDSDVEIARVVYIPVPASGQTVTKVKISTRVAGGTVTTAPILQAYLEPLVSLGIPAVDKDLGVGVEELV